ncbi:DUF6163 family protein [Mangrovicella endophytica]|uniref:DUF6163 family protein n=1 Tax=Mangrovicella endophytica TaxID=2066697 RepID=UPI000C9E908E|nr:DUF6163 family protein [Mangrovicella endophytica]
MTIGLPQQDAGETLNRLLTVWLFRIASLAFFAVGIFYWTRLVGVEEGPLRRFDLMPYWWQIAAPALAVLYPVAGVGLWMLVGWGAAVWVITAAIEAVMHLGFPHLYGPGTIALSLHGFGISLLVMLRLVRWLERRRKHRRRHGG